MLPSIHLSLLLFSLRPYRKSGWQNHICSLVECLHADTIQQLELALLGSPAAKLLDILSVSLQHQAVPPRSTSIPFCPSTTSSTPSSPPSIQIMGISEMAGLVEAKVSMSKISPPKTSSEIEATSPKHRGIIPLLISLSHFQIPAVYLPNHLL